MRQIVADSAEHRAHRYVADLDALARLRLAAMRRLAGFDALLVPTTTAQPTLAEVAADPIGTNATLGTYTNFANLLDLCAVAVPAGFADDGRFGVTVLGRAHHDAVVADVAGLLTGDPPGPVAAGPRPAGVDLVVLGAHLSGLACNAELTAVGGRLVGAVRTAPVYRLHRLPGTPARPALVRASGDGVAIAGEIWSLPPAALGEFAARIPAPLSLGRVELADGSTRLGFLGEAAACASAPDITAYGGWRAYLAAEGAF